MEETLRSLWGGSRSEISTGRIVYDHLLLIRPERDVTPDEFVDWLQEQDLVSRSEPFRDVLMHFRPSDFTDPKEGEKILAGCTDERTLLFSGSRQRRCQMRTFEQVVDEDLAMLVDHPNRNIKAFHRGQTYIANQTLNWFRVVPEDDSFRDAFLSAGADYYRISSAPPDETGSSLIVDAGDGLPRRVDLVNQGRLMRLELYDCYTTYAGDACCPALRVSAEIRDGLVDRVALTLIRSAEFNLDVSQEDFRLSAPMEWAWHDERTEEALSGVWKRPVDDVAAFFRSHNELPMQRISRVQSTAPFSLRSLLFIAKGIILIGFGVVLWRRA